MKIEVKKENKLGEYIKVARRQAGLSQAQLGERVGLKASRISKIENGAPITNEVASFILGKMGADIQVNMVKPKQSLNDITSFISPIVLKYARAKNIPLKRAYKYLRVFKGINHLLEFKEVEQTLPYEKIISNLNLVCSHHGGLL